MEIYTININGLDIDVKISLKKVKNISIRISNNEVLATRPINISDKIFYNFINSKSNWIYKHIIKSNINLIYNNDDRIYIFKKLYLLKFVSSVKTYYFNDDCLCVKDKTQLNKLLNNMLLNYLNDLYIQYKYVLEDNGYKLAPLIKLRDMKKTFGTCFTKRNTIVFSKHLIHYSKDFIRCIYLHEISHFFYPNHSSKFYDFLLKYCSDYKKIIKDR